MGMSSCYQIDHEEEIEYGDKIRKKRASLN